MATEHSIADLFLNQFTEFNTRLKSIESVLAQRDSKQFISSAVQWENVAEKDVVDDNKIMVTKPFACEAFSRIAISGIYVDASTNQNVEKIAVQIMTASGWAVLQTIEPAISTTDGDSSYDPARGHNLIATAATKTVSFGFVINGGFGTLRVWYRGTAAVDGSKLNVYMVGQ
jgi:hypothetical protein